MELPNSKYYVLMIFIFGQSILKKYGLACGTYTAYLVSEKVMQWSFCHGVYSLSWVTAAKPSESKPFVRTLSSGLLVR